MTSIPSSRFCPAAAGRARKAGARSNNERPTSEPRHSCGASARGMNPAAPTSACGIQFPQPEARHPGRGVARRAARFSAVSQKLLTEPATSRRAGSGRAGPALACAVLIGALTRILHEPQRNIDATYCKQRGCACSLNIGVVTHCHRSVGRTGPIQTRFFLLSVPRCLCGEFPGLGHEGRPLSSNTGRRSGSRSSLRPGRPVW